MILRFGYKLYVWIKDKAKNSLSYCNIRLLDMMQSISKRVSSADSISAVVTNSSGSFSLHNAPAWGEVCTIFS